MTEDTNSFELTGFQRDLLYIIAGSDEPSGQTIGTKLENYTDSVGHGRLYTNLDILVEQSLITKGAQDQRTNYYALTPAGEELLKKRRQWENKVVTGLFAAQGAVV